MNAVTFNGSNYLVGAPPFADGAFGRGIFSYFYNGAANLTCTILAGTDGTGNGATFEHQLDAGGMYLRVRLWGNSGAAGAVEFRALDPIPHDGRWFGVVIAWNTLAPGGIVSAWAGCSALGYGSSALALQQVEGAESAAFSINPADLSWIVGQGFRGCLSEVWFMGGSNDYTDLDGAASVGPLLLMMAGGEEFVGVPGKGSTGQVPIGSLAQIYLHGPAATFANNHGFAFTQNGSGLADCANGPAPRMTAVQIGLSIAKGIANFVGGKLSRTDNAILNQRTQAVRG